MVRHQNIFSEYSAELNQREIDLLKQKKAILSLLQTEHTADEAKKCLTKLLNVEASLTSTMVLLVEAKTVNQYKRQAEKLCAHGYRLNDYCCDLRQTLQEDIACQRVMEKASEKVESSDAIKNISFLLGVPGILATAVKNGIGSNILEPYQAAIGGFALSSSILLRKDISRAFKTAATAVCSIPSEVRHSFLLYYVRETMKEKGRSAVLVFRKGLQRPVMVAASAMHRGVTYTEKREP